MHQPLVVLIILILLFVISIITWFLLKNIFLLGTGILFLLLFLFTLYFFRDPARQAPDVKNIIIAPADGRVVDITYDQQLLSFDEKFIKISIYLSLWDVHINRIPISGEIIFLQYKKGEFYPAYKSKASQKNESNVIGIKTKIGKVFVKQIAGIIARRIDCTIKKGEKVTMGQRFGIIKFGSRVELFLPPSVELTVSVDDYLRGGETIVGKIL
ncbi:MAG: phosphatidylserine decarboxylase family protein [bacterium]